MLYELRRADRDLVSLTVLGMLLRGPSHTYEMHRLILDTHKDFVTGLPRSMYHAVERLLRDELIVAVETSRAGNRPERTVYRLTDEGRAELTFRVRRLLATPDPDATLLTAALSFVACLTVDAARQALAERVALLTGKAAGARSAVDALRDRLPRVLQIEVEYELARTEAELAWTEALVSDLDSGALDWAADVTQLAVPGENPAEKGKS